MKRILIVGGGISGAATLHYLSCRYHSNPDVEIKLLESGSDIGGTVHSHIIGGTIFESGPNGFLSNSQETLSLIEDLGLKDELIEADSHSKFRYIYANNKLHTVPYSLGSFLGFSLLSFSEKLNILKAIVKPLKHKPDMTIAEFARENIGSQFERFVMDPMVTGIYGGDIGRLNIKHCFPKLASILDSGYSVLKYRKNNKAKRKGRSKLYSFKGGMQTLLNYISNDHNTDITYNESAESIEYNHNQFTVTTKHNTYNADHIILSTPAYTAGHLLTPVDDKLGQALKEIEYSPIAVVGFKFDKSHVDKIPPGFGLLIPSSENNQVLGILFESQIYPQRYKDNELVIRMMLGGAHHKNIVEHSEKEIIDRALKELVSHFTINELPVSTFFKLWPKAIPQYTNDYKNKLNIINTQLTAFPNLHIVSNYYKGISFNDCIANAKHCALSLEL